MAPLTTRLLEKTGSSVCADEAVALSSATAVAAALAMDPFIIVAPLLGPDAGQDDLALSLSTLAGLVLREREAGGFVTCTVHTGVPPKVELAPSARWRSLEPSCLPRRLGARRTSP